MKQFKKVWDTIFIFCILSFHAIWAALPKPPDNDLANESKNWVEAGMGIAFKALKLTAIGLGALILFGLAGAIAKAYQVAQERQDIGHFFKYLIAGLICAAIIIAIIYFGYQALGDE